MAVITVMLAVIMVHLELEEEEGAERRALGLWQRKQVLCRGENYDSQGITKTEEKTPNSFVDANEIQRKYFADIK